MGAGGLGGSVGFEMPRVCPRAVDPLPHGHRLRPGFVNACYLPRGSELDFAWLRSGRLLLEASAQQESRAMGILSFAVCR